MKKILLSGVCTSAFVMLFNVVNAQVTATSNLNVHITEQLKVDFGDGSVNGGVGSGDVDLYFNTPEDYVNGVRATKNGHLLITSTKGYTVDVNTQTTTLTGGGSTSIAADAIKVKLLSTNSSDIVGNTTGLNLASAAGHFITSAPATTKSSIDVEYFTAPGDKRFVGVGAGTYATRIVYTVTAN